MRTAWALLLTALLLWCAPHALAQGPAAPRLTLHAVNADSFPAVSAFVDVFGPDGLPLAGLGASSFSVFEDGQPAEVTAVQTDDSQGITLLLALDRSTDADSWTQIQAAANAVLDTLRPQDLVGITVFFDEVQLVQGFTADREAARAALNQITPGGEFSALNPALVDAVNRTAAATTTRRSVVLIADAPDNISGVTAADAIATVTGQGVPVYVVGFGERVQGSADFAGIASATGGNFFDLAAATALPGTLQTLTRQLQQGYRVEFLSGLQADNQPHNLTVQVITPQGAQLEASGEFQAISREVVVTLSGIGEGQPVAGVVSLQAQVSAPGPLASLEYRIDGQSIGTVQNAAETVAWDTTGVEPGTHTLEVIATDVAGNRGQVSVSVVVVRPQARASIVGLDSSQFPAVDIYVDVFGDNGLPLVGLTAGNFGVTEDGAAVPTDVLSADVDASQPLGLVLALDRSMPVADWTIVRNGLNSLVDSLRPQDTMAVYAYADSVQLVQQATSDPNALKAAIATIQPVDDTAGAPPANALHQVLLDATNLAGVLPEGRRALVAVINAADDTGELTLDTMTQVLGDQDVPAHIIGFGPGVQGTGLVTALAQVTGGNGVALSGPSDVRGTLQQLALLLQQGYRLSYTSGLRADNAEHTLVVTANAGDVAAEASERFVAVARPVTVTVPNLGEGAVVGGAVDLTAQAEAPAAIASVEYRLNGEELATVEDIGSSIIWNSDTYPPGAYTLQVTVVDQAGNTGETTVNFTVVAPVVVTAALVGVSSDGPTEVGDELEVEATVEAINDIARVEFFFDGLSIATDQTAPYRATIDTRTFDPGAREITVVATDDAGYAATSAIPVDLLAPATPTPAPQAVAAPPADSPAAGEPAGDGFDFGPWLRWIGIGALLILGGLAVFALFLGMSRGRAPKVTPMRLSLSNLGNIATSYLLKGDDPAGALRFQFSMNGTPLGMPPVARAEPTLQTAPIPGPASPGARPNGGPVMPGMPQPLGQGVQVPAGVSNAAANLKGQDAGQLADTVVEAGATARMIAQILYSISYMLPRPMGRPLMQVATMLRRGGMFATRVQYTRRQIDRLGQNKMGKQLMQGTQQAAQGAHEVATSPQAQQAMAGAGHSAGTSLAGAAGAAASGAGRLFDLTTTKAREIGRQAYDVGSAAVQRVTGSDWVYVPRLNPGDSVNIDVLVSATKSVRGTQRVPFRIRSRALGAENAEVATEEGTIQIVGSGGWRWWMWLVVLALLVIAALLVYLLVFSGGA